MSSESLWSSDVPVSMPLVSENQLMVSMDGFAFSTGGMAHDLTDADATRISIPDFTPEHPGALVYDDGDGTGEFTDLEVF